MANRDAKKIERTLKDFSLGAVGGGAGLTPVNALPEKGNVGTLYKTPDGNIYSWFHEERQEEVEVPDFSIGGTYQLNTSVDFDDFKNFTDKLIKGLIHDNYNEEVELQLIEPVNEEENYKYFYIQTERSLNDEQGDYYYMHRCRFSNYSYLDEVGPDEHHAEYSASYWSIKPAQSVEFYLIPKGILPPYITITQEFANKLAEEGFTLEDIAFMFIAGTKTETITVVEEGYTQLNGIVLDYDKIINNAIFLDDKNYNAQIIYDTLLRGGSALLKTSGLEDSFSLQCLRSTVFSIAREGILGALMTFENNNINVILENQFDPISTIKGQELIDLIQAYEPMEINNLNLINYIASISSSEEANKELYRGIAISLFEGLIEYDLFYPLPDEEEAPSGVTQIAHFVPKAYRDDVLTAYPEKGQLNCLEFLAQNIGNGYVSNSNLSEIDATKDYNCDIIVKFSDGTTKTVPMDKHLLYGVEGDDESPLFRVHIMN